MTFTKGSFNTYKAITKIHLGALETNLEKGEVIEFDGATMRRGSKDEPMPSLAAAIKVGWLVPDTSEEVEYKAKPAGVKVHSAKNMGEKPQEVEVKTVFEEERGIGTLQEVRPDNAPSTHIAKQAGTTHLSKDTDEGRVVGKFKSSAKSEPIQVGKDDRRVVETLDNKSKLEVEKVAVATGDVQEPLTGDNLEEILPEAVSSKKPESGISGEGETQLSQEERAEQVVAEEKPLESNQVAEIKIQMLKSLVEGFEWDLTDHWKTRVKNALSYKDNPAVFDQIMSFESETVVNHVKKQVE